MSRERIWERRQYFEQIRGLTINCTAIWNLVVFSLEQLDHQAGTFAPQFGARQHQALMLQSEKENQYACNPHRNSGIFQSRGIDIADFAAFEQLAKLQLL